MMLQPISEALVPQCLALQVSIEQRKHNKSPAEIFANAYLHQDVLRAFVLEGANPVVVGMASYFNNTVRGYGYWISQFFIDHRYQRQGHGTKAFGMLFAEIKAIADHRIIVSADEENQTAIALYQKFGFTWMRDERYPDELLLAVELNSNHGVHGRLASSPP